MEIEEGRLLNRPESRKGLDKSRRGDRKCDLLRRHGSNFSFESGLAAS